VGPTTSRAIASCTYHPVINGIRTYKLEIRVFWAPPHLEYEYEYYPLDPWKYVSSRARDATRRDARARVFPGAHPTTQEQAPRRRCNMLVGARARASPSPRPTRHDNNPRPKIAAHTQLSELPAARRYSALLCTCGWISLELRRPTGLYCGPTHPLWCRHSPSSRSSPVTCRADGGHD
jgi:hypothetical protein